VRNGGAEESERGGALCVCAAAAAAAAAAHFQMASSEGEARAAGSGGARSSANSGRLLELTQLNSCQRKFIAFTFASSANLPPESGSLWLAGRLAAESAAVAPAAAIRRRAGRQAGSEQRRDVARSGH